jgi:predicted RNase H-like HicB family nuclease
MMGLKLHDLFGILRNEAMENTKEVIDMCFEEANIEIIGF